MQLRQKLYLSTVLLAVFVAVAVGFALLSLSHLKTESQAGIELLEAESALARLRVASMGLGGGVHTDTQWLAAAEVARKEIRDVVKLWNDRPALQAIDREIVTLEDYFKRSGGMAAASKSSELARRTELVDIHFDLAHEMALEGELVQEKSFTRLVSVLAACLVLLTLVGSAISLIAIRNFVTLVEQLTEGARALGEGALDYRIPVRALNEFHGLAESFNEMASNLRKKTVSLDALEGEVEERRRAEKSVEEKGRYLFLLESVSLAASRAEIVNDALAACVKLIAQHLHWPVGLVYLPGEEGDELHMVPAASYVEDPEKFGTFVSLSEKYAYRAGIGLPGLVLRRRTVQWIEKVCDRDEYLRGALARDAGLQGVVAFPVLVGDEVAAVCEFLSPLPLAPDSQVAEVLTHIGIQLGRAIERHRAIAVKTHLETIFEGSADAIMAADIKGIFTHWNPAAERLFGYRAEEIIGRPVKVLYFSEAEQDLIAQSLRGEHFVDHEVRRRHKDGHEIVVALSLAPLVGVDGRIYGFSGIARDVSDKKRAEIAVRESERGLAEAQQVARLGSWHYDFATRTASWSKMMYTIFERGENDPPLDARAFRAVIHPDDVASVVPRLEEALAKQAPRASIDCRIQVPSGEERWVLFQTEYEYDRDGRPVRSHGTALDITERKRFERRIAESEANFRLIFAGNPLPMWVFDLETLRFVEVNGAAVDHYGYSREEFLAMQVNDIGPVDSADGESRHRTKSGAMITVESSSYAFEREGRRVKLVVINDITERKLVEQALRLQARALENMAESVYVADREGKILYTNAACDRMFGYERGELLGEQASRLNALSADENSRVMGRIWTTLSESGRWAGDLSCRRKDGSSILTHAVLSLLDTSGETYFISVQEDITEERNMESALREREQRFRFLLEQLPAYVWTTDRDLRIIFCAGGTAVANRRAPASYVGKSFREMASQDPCLEAAVSAHCLALEGKAAGYDLTQEEQCFTAHLEPYRDAAGNIQGVLGVALETSEHRAAEEKLRKLTEELLRSNQELDEFAHIVSHDLQEPLRMVTCYLNLLAQRYGGRLDKPAADFISFAVDGAQRMKGLINDLLSYSRVGSRGGRFVEVAAEEPLRAAMRNLKVAIEESSAEITIGPMPRILADSAQLAQLFQNLISNSIKFRGSQVPRITVQCSEEANEWIFSVRDNGIGFEMHETSRVFQIFQRLHTRGEYPGSGVGLAVCKRIVGRHGGRIWAESRPGEGSSFFFALPKAPPVDASAGLAESEDADADKKTVDFSWSFEQNRVVG